jgi:HSP20 family protein
MLPSLWTPMSEELSTLHRNIDQLFNRFFGPMEGVLSRTASSTQAGWYPAIECYTEDGEVHVNCLIPGVDPQHVHVSVLGNQPTIRGERPWDEKLAQSRRYFFREFPYGSFERTIVLPENVDADKVHAKFVHGVLQVTLPASGAVAPKRIEIQMGEPALTS